MQLQTAQTDIIWIMWNCVCQLSSNCIIVHCNVLNHSLDDGHSWDRKLWLFFGAISFSYGVQSLWLKYDLRISNTLVLPSISKKHVRARMRSEALEVLKLIWDRLTGIPRIHFWHTENHKYFQWLHFTAQTGSKSPPPIPLQFPTIWRGVRWKWR